MYLKVKSVGVLNIALLNLSISGRDQLKIDPKDTLAVSKIAQACHDSAHTGKIVQLKWDKDELPLYLQS